MITAAACGAASAPRGTPATNAAPPVTCVADDLAPLRIDGHRLTCEPTACEAECAAGEADACAERGYQVQGSGAADASAASDAWFRRACQLGHATACTNFGAQLWLADAAPATDVVCAGRLFDAACAAGEHFGCGMAGRLLVEGSDDAGDQARGRALLATSCASVGGFACRVLAIMPGVAATPPTPTMQLELLERACDGGDGEACDLLPADNADDAPP